MLEPDWAALADIQFLLYNRISNQLNEALSGIALSDMPEATDKPPGYWKERATNQITSVLNLYTAWMWLLRYKTGDPIPERAFRPFETNSLLSWIGRQLQLSPPPITKMNPLLHGNQETLQEALLLLHSVAYTQGSAVRLVFEATRLGTWFRIRFDRPREVPPDLDSLIASFGSHWRAQDAVFELTNARDFVRLNGCALVLNRTQSGGEFTFFVRSASARRRSAKTDAGAQVTAQPKTATVPKSRPKAQPEQPAAQEPAQEPAQQPAAQAPDQAVAKKSDTRIDPDAVQQAAQRHPTPPPGRTKPLDEAALARYLERHQQRSQLRPDDPTPIVSFDEHEALSDESHEAASQALVDAGETHSGTTQPGPVQRRTRSLLPPTAARSSTDSAAEGTQPAAEPPVPPHLDPKRKTDTVIIKANIPAPHLPDHLRKPPATTSNVALTRDTQTFAPVSADQQLPKADDAAPPAAGETNSAAGTQEPPAPDNSVPNNNVTNGTPTNGPTTNSEEQS